MNSVDDCRLVDLPRVERPEGSITPVEAGTTVPFEIARVYYIYDIVGGSERGAHAHLELEQLVTAVMGALTVVLDDGQSRREVELNHAYVGLHIPRMIWRELRNFSSGAVCVVLASIPYSEDDYVRDYETFTRLRAEGAED
jgi:dTDP-4-dehydrorhamnose 3,5-epimerase-like enzyme